jgi:hypothetical protein
MDNQASTPIANVSEFPKGFLGYHSGHKAQKSPPHFSCENSILCCTHLTQGMRLDFGRQNIIKFLFGTRDRISSTHVTYYSNSNPYISHALECAQLTLPITLSQIQSCYLYQSWNTFNLHAPSLSQIHTYYKLENAQSICAITLTQIHTYYKRREATGDRADFDLNH